MKVAIIRNACWLVFLVGYSLWRYFLGVQGWNFGFAIQVLVIVMLTAIIPYYATLWSSALFEGISRYLFLAITPTILSMFGHGMFYLAYLQSNFPGISAVDVIFRGFVPGFTIAAILLLTGWLESAREDHPAGDLQTSSSQDS